MFCWYIERLQSLKINNKGLRKKHHPEQPLGNSSQEPRQWVSQWLTSSVQQATCHHMTPSGMDLWVWRWWQRACVSWWEGAGNLICWSEAWGSPHAVLGSARVRSLTWRYSRSAALSAPHFDILVHYLTHLPKWTSLPSFLLRNASRRLFTSVFFLALSSGMCFSEEERVPHCFFFFFFFMLMVFTFNASYWDLCSVVSLVHKWQLTVI